MDFNTPLDMPIGTILSSGWNGMSDYYRVVGHTAKSLKVQKVEWETCEGPEPADPVHRWCRIAYPFRNQGSERRVMAKFLKNGGFTVSLGWSGRDRVTVYYVPENGVEDPAEISRPQLFFWD